jgi:hypothetical protein
MGRSRGSPRARLAPLPTPAEKTPSLLSITASLLSNLSLSWQMIVCNCQMASKTVVSPHRFDCEICLAHGHRRRFPCPFPNSTVRLTVISQAHAFSFLTSTSSWRGQ